MLLTRIQERVLPTGLAEPSDPHGGSRLHAAATAYQHALDTLAERNGLAA
jgi:hypothetical protein